MDVDKTVLTSEQLNKAIEQIDLEKKYHLQYAIQNMYAAKSYFTLFIKACNQANELTDGGTIATIPDMPDEIVSQLTDVRDTLNDVISKCKSAE